MGITTDTFNIKLRSGRVLQMVTKEYYYSIKCSICNIFKPLANDILCGSCRSVVEHWKKEGLL
jgi:hypothetical protein